MPGFNASVRGHHALRVSGLAGKVQAAAHGLGQLRARADGLGDGGARVRATRIRLLGPLDPQGTQILPPRRARRQVLPLRPFDLAPPARRAVEVLRAALGALGEIIQLAIA